VPARAEPTKRVTRDRGLLGIEWRNLDLGAPEQRASDAGSSAVRRAASGEPGFLEGLAMVLEVLRLLVMQGR
jgi:hypothetical protein